MKTQVYATINTINITGFSVWQLDYWDRQGLVTPSIQQSHGPGSRRLYSLDDLVKLRFIRQLKNHGWSTQKIRKHLSQLCEVMDDPDPLRHAVLLRTRTTIVALFKTKQGERILVDTGSAGGQQIMSIVIETIRGEIQDAEQILAAEGVGRGQ